MKFVEHAFKEIVMFVILAVLIVLPIRLFLAQPFVVEGESMHPTFENGDYLIVDELTYRFEAPKRGDVIVFRYPGNPSIFYIKRIIGLPGESVAISHGVVTVTKTDGTTLTLTEPYVKAEDASYATTTHLGTGEYYVLGDNRPNSSDSRVWGVLPAADIVGRPILRLLPPPELGVYPGAADDPQ
jgi:signal peptidase I